jgi:putative peptide maturation system protein
MQRAFEGALVDAVLLLQELPRQRGERGLADSRLRHFRETHPDVRADLLVDDPPGSSRFDYDLLLGLPGDAGTLALSWRVDSGVPWNIEYADHWAANFVLTVDGLHVTIQQALSFLKFWAKHSPDLTTELVDQTLVAQAIAGDPPPVSELEILAAEEQFRMERGFGSLEAMNRWLQETGLSITAFEALVRQSIQRHKLQWRVTEPQVESYFQAHEKDLETVQFVLAETPNRDIALRLAGAAAHQNLLTAAGALAGGAGCVLTVSLSSKYTCDLPAELRAASDKAIIGPVTEASRHWLGQVLQRFPARLNEATRAAIRKLLFRQWLMERRERASLRWHWF